MFDAITEELENASECVRPIFQEFERMPSSVIEGDELRRLLRALSDRMPHWKSTAPQLGRLFSQTQEIVLDKPWMCLAIRPRIAQWAWIEIDLESLTFRQLDQRNYLIHLERVVQGGDPASEYALELDFYSPLPSGARLKESRNIGSGVQYLNRHLASRLFRTTESGAQLLLEFLSVHEYQGKALMLNGTVKSVSEFRGALDDALQLLEGYPDDCLFDTISNELARIGFEAGWGRDVGRTRSLMRLLQDILEAPDHANLERFLSAVPMIFTVAIMTPHGWFGQADVLGRPDTGGQVVYILDQVKALEREIRARLHEQGVPIEPTILVVTRLIPEADGTTCNQRVEPIAGTRSSKILRVPFRDESGEVLPEWISRFEVWPYLEQFARDAEVEIRAEAGRTPDLVIGNYSDGNLVAYRLARRLGVTHCTIAHALEKTKYSKSAQGWKELEDEYHFSCQFTADLITMNASDFVISSTFQEVAGTTSQPGQYESYQCFSMPGLFRVINGIDVFDPKFNIVAPGADSEVFFPYTEGERRFHALTQDIESLVYGPPGGSAVGQLSDRELPIIFTMARLDRVKNIAGLVSWFCESSSLHEQANLLLVAGHVRVEDSDDKEEKEQIALVQDLIDKSGLSHRIRWIGDRLEKQMSGELYRFVADQGGVFVQPALFEAFGLTVIEAMSSGLPTFATSNGGPREIIEHGISGFHLDPSDREGSIATISDFLERSAHDRSVWEEVSKAGIRRVEERYTWKLYAERLMTLSRVYGFWRFVTNLERHETLCYIDALYGLLYRPRAMDL